MAFIGILPNVRKSFISYSLAHLEVQAMNENEPSLKSIFRGPIIFAMIIAAAFFLMGRLNPSGIDGLLDLTPLACIATVTIVVLTFLAGGRADFILGIEFNGFYFAAIPTGIFLSLLLLAISAPFFK